ncbi:MAG: hypothetical protein ACYTDU_03490 [Planctomycetota bacterium]|jgi:hypothetical protein
MGKLRIAYLIVAVAGCAKESSEPARAEDIRDFQASVERIGTLSDGRSGVAVELKIPQRGSEFAHTVSEWWSVEKKELLVWISSKKRDGNGPYGLGRTVVESEAPRAAQAIPGEWTLRVLYSYGELGDGVAVEAWHELIATTFLLPQK